MYAKKISSPINVQLEITDNCNEKCLHCYNSWQLNTSQRGKLTEEKVDRIVDQLSKNNVFHATITGGEPLLRKELTLFTLQELQKREIMTTLNTNLTLMDEYVAKKLEQYGVGFILTSLISSDPNVHNFVSQNNSAFEQWVEGLRLVQNNTNIQIGANMVLTQYNKNNIYKTGKFLNDLGIKNFFVTRGSFPAGMDNFAEIAVSGDETKEGLRDLIKVKEDFQMRVIDILECYPLCFLAEDPDFYQFSHHKCTAGITSATIGVNGMVRPCSHTDMEYGNIFDEELKDIWDRMDDRRNGEYLPQKCKDCEYLSSCSGGCRVDAEGQNGSKDEMDPFAKIENIKKIKDMKKPGITSMENMKGHNLKIINNIIFRAERDGYLIGKGLNQIYVTKDSGVLVQMLKRKESFTIKEVSIETGISESILDNFLSILYKKNIIHIL